MDTIKNFWIVNALSSNIHNSEFGLREVPDCLLQTIETGAWRHYQTESGREFQHEQFVHFVEAQPFEGLGATIKQLERLCVEHPKAREALRAVQHGGVGGDRKSDEYRGKNKNNNITDDKSVTGTSVGYTLDRLHREAPELYEQVCAGEKSANAAAIEAGFRKKKIQVEPTPEGFARAVANNLDEEQTSRLLALLKA